MFKLRNFGGCKHQTKSVPTSKVKACCRLQFLRKKSTWEMVCKHKTKSADISRWNIVSFVQKCELLNKAWIHVQKKPNRIGENKKNLKNSSWFFSSITTKLNGVEFSLGRCHQLLRLTGCQVKSESCLRPGELKNDKQGFNHWRSARNSFPPPRAVWTRHA